MASKSRDTADTQGEWRLECIPGSTGDTKASVMLVYMSVDFRDSLRIIKRLTDRLEPRAAVIAKLQTNPDYSKKSAKVQNPSVALSVALSLAQFCHCA